MNTSVISSPTIVRVARSWIRYSPLSLFKRWLWTRASWRTHDYLARTRHGNWMKGRSTDLVQGYIYYFGELEPNLTRWMMRRLSTMNGRTFVDVGANVGYYTVLAAAALRARGAVVAIEASPVIHRMLEDNVRANALENVRTVCCAAMSEPGRITLFHGSENNLGGTTTSEGIASDRRGTLIEGRRLADLLGDEEVARVRLVKIDVEGAEWSVLQGLMPAFGKLPHDVELVIEVVPGLMKVDDVTQLFDFMEREGFNAYRIENSYDVKDYLRRGKPKSPYRLYERPVDGGDVVFSRIDAATL